MKVFLTTIILLITTFGYAKSNADSTILVKPVICAVSVDTSNSFFNIIYWENLDSNATKFIIYYKDKYMLDFDTLSIVSAKKFNEYRLTNQIYGLVSFKIQATTDSGSKSDMSEIVNNVFLTALEVKDDEVVRLNWTDIQADIGDSVLIWRNDIWSRYYTPIKKLSVTDTMFFDTLNVFWLIEYRLEIIKMESCYSGSDTSNAVRIFATSANAHFGAVSTHSFQKINVYPNPVKKLLTFNSSIALENANINIYNTMGQLVLKDKLTQNELNVSVLPQGIYNFSIERNGMNYRGKFIKQ
jgi:hypothetical protein